MANQQEYVTEDEGGVTVVLPRGHEPVRHAVLGPSLVPDLVPGRRQALGKEAGRRIARPSHQNVVLGPVPGYGPVSPAVISLPGQSTGRNIFGISYGMRIVFVLVVGAVCTEPII